MSLVELEGVSFGYTASPVVRDVSLRVESGEYVGIVEGATLVDFLLLDRGADHAQRTEARLVARAHRRLDGIGQLRAEFTHCADAPQ